MFLHSTNVTSTVVADFGPMERPQLVLCPAPLYHTNGFTAFRTLLGGDPIVLLERFKAPLVLDLIERHRITGFIAATPMLQRLAQVPGIEDRDLSSLTWVQQGASPLPVWLGHRWIELVGAEHFYMSYGASESFGIVVCRGDQWLAHPGTLGRGMSGTEIRVLGESGEPLPPGEIGGIYLRTPTGPLATYVGSDVKPMDTTADGFTSVGDLGWLDEDGFLYMADRRVDMIVTGRASTCSRPRSRRPSASIRASTTWWWWGCGTRSGAVGSTPSCSPVTPTWTPSRSPRSPGSGWPPTRCPSRSSSSRPSPAARP